MTETSTVEVRVGGAALDLAAQVKPCSHRTFTAQPLCVLFEDDGEVTGRAVKLKVRCAECGIPMRLGAARPSETDGDLAVVVEMEPAEETPDGY